MMHFCRCCTAEALTETDIPVPGPVVRNWLRCGQCNSLSSPWRYEEVKWIYDEAYLDITKGHVGSAEALLRECTENAEVIARHANGTKFLDIGCCEGSMLKQFSSRGWLVRGFDVIPGAQDRAAYAGIDRGDIVIGQQYRAGMFRETFDAINIREVIEHVPDPLDTLRQAVASLSPGGILHVQTPHAEGKDAQFWNQAQHIQIFSERQLANTMRALGLVLVPDACKWWESGMYLTGRKA